MKYLKALSIVFVSVIALMIAVVLLTPPRPAWGPGTGRDRPGEVVVKAAPTQQSLSRMPSGSTTNASSRAQAVSTATSSAYRAPSLNFMGAFNDLHASSRWLRYVEKVSLVGSGLQIETSLPQNKTTQTRTFAVAICNAFSYEVFMNNNGIDWLRVASATGTRFVAKRYLAEPCWDPDF